MINSKNTYKLFADYYDLYVDGYSEDLNFYKSVCKPTDQIIEIGCGTGRVLKYFLSHGFSVTGVDISEEMLDKTKEKLIDSIKTGRLILLNHDFTQHPLEQKFNKAFITFYTFNYILDKPVEFLSNVFQSLCKNGMLVLDLFYPKSMGANTPRDKWTEHEFTADNRQIRLRDNRFVENNIEYRTQIYIEGSQEICIKSNRRYFSPAEITSYLEEAGFTNITFSLFFDPDQFSFSIDEALLNKNYLVIAQRS